VDTRGVQSLVKELETATKNTKNARFLRDQDHSLLLSNQAVIMKALVQVLHNQQEAEELAADPSRRLPH
jgi:hypothetical protein